MREGSDDEDVTEETHLRSRFQELNAQGQNKEGNLE